MARDIQYQKPVQSPDKSYWMTARIGEELADLTSLKDQRRARQAIAFILIADKFVTWWKGIWRRRRDTLLKVFGIFGYIYHEKSDRMILLKRGKRRLNMEVVRAHLPSEYHSELRDAHRDYFVLSVLVPKFAKNGKLRSETEIANRCNAFVVTTLGGRVDFESTKSREEDDEDHIRTIFARKSVDFPEHAIEFTPIINVFKPKYKPWERQAPEPTSFAAEDSDESEY